MMPCSNCHRGQTNGKRKLCSRCGEYAKHRERDKAFAKLCQQIGLTESEALRNGLWKARFTA